MPPGQQMKMDLQPNSVINEQLKIVYRQLPGIILLPGTTAILLAIIFWGEISTTRIIGWLSIALLFTGGTAGILYYLYKRTPFTDCSTAFWCNWFNTLAILSGISWSSSIFFLYTEDNLVLQLVLLLFLYLAIALVAITMTAYQPAFVWLAAPILLAIIIRLLADFDRLHALLALTTVFYGITLYAFYYFAHRDFISHIQLGYEKNKLANELQQRSIEAENSNLAKSRFLAAASHDLRQPLVAQELLISALKAHVGEDRFSDIFRNLKNNIEALHALFNELVEVSRLDTGNIRPQIDYTELDDLLKELDEQFQPQAREKNIQLEIRTDVEAVMSDRHLLKRILVNLISNAIKYTPQGSVTVYQQVIDDKIHIIVEDTGIGIKPSEQAAVFHEFYRSHNASSYSDGFGLGLAIVQRLSSLLDHDLQLFSEEGSGTRFVLVTDSVPELDEFPEPDER